MQTTLYNTTTNQLIGKFREGWYKVDGVRPQLEDHIVELVVTATEPDYNPATHKAVSNWESDLVEMQWKQVWTYTDKTESELIAEAEAKAEAIDNNIETKMLKEHLRKLIVFESDEDLLAAMELFPAWKPGISVVADEVYQHNDNLYRVIQSHTTQLDWPPEIVPALFTQVAPPGTIPQWVQPQGAHDAYPINAEVIHNGQHYISTVPSNVWEPGVYGWQLVTQ